MERKYKITKILASVLVFFFVLALVIGYGFAEGETDNTKKQSDKQSISTNVKWLVFSPTDYPHERNLVIKFNDADIKSAEKISGQKVEIFIALEDLNGDKDKEIFAYFVNPIYCGAKGNCSLYVFMKIQGKLKSIGPAVVPYIPIDEKGQQDVIGILNTERSDWKDMLIGKFTYKWTGSKYEVVRK